jgi:hypothetical protein
MRRQIMAEPYKDVTFGRERLTAEKLNAVVNNTNWLKEHLPEMAFEHEGIKKDVNLKWLAGSALLQPTQAWSLTAEVRFGNYFSTGCRPILMTALHGYPQTGVVHTTYGIGDQRTPDNRGFAVYIVPYDRSGFNSKIMHPINISYLAIGW